MIPKTGPASRVCLVDPATGLTYAAGSPFDPASIEALEVLEARAEANYVKVAASQTAALLGGAGTIGDFLAGVLVIPTSLSPGVVTALDLAVSIPLFAGGASSLLTLQPFYIPFGAVSVSGTWKITTGANLSIIAFGNFTS